MQQQSGTWGGDGDQVKMESFFNVVKKNKAMGSLNQQLEQALMDAKAHIEEIKRQFRERTENLNATHPNMAKQAAAARMKGEDVDEKLFESMQYVMIIEALKAEVVRLQESSQRSQAEAQLAGSLIQDTLQQARSRKKARAAALMSGDETRHMGRMDDGDIGFDSDKRENLLYMIRVFQDDYKRQVLESEFRENQLHEYSAHMRKMQEDASRLNGKLAQFRARKQGTLEGPLRQSSSTSSFRDDDSDPLVARIHQLQAQDDHEFEALQQTLDSYDRSSAGPVAGDAVEAEDDSDEESSKPNAPPPSAGRTTPSTRDLQYRGIIESLRQELRSLSQRNKELEVAVRGKHKAGTFLLGAIHEEVDAKAFKKEPSGKKILSFLDAGEVGAASLERFISANGGGDKKDHLARMQFYRALREYRELWDPTDPRAQTNALVQQPTANELLNRFLLPQAGKPPLVRVSAATLGEAKRAVEDEHATAVTFDLVLDEVLSALTAPFSQFVTTPEYAAVLKQMAQLRESPTSYSVDIERTLDTYRAAITKGPSGGFFGAKKPPTLYAHLMEGTGGGMRVETLLEKMVAERNLLLYQLTAFRQGKDGSGAKDAAAPKALPSPTAVALPKETLRAVAKSHGAIRGVQRTVADLRDEMRSATSDMTELFGTMGRAVLSVSSVLATAQSNYRAEVNKRIQLFDALQNMRGNIRVFCRVRPLLPSELAAGKRNCIEFLGATQMMVVKPSTGDAIPLVSEAGGQGVYVRSCVRPASGPGPRVRGREVPRRLCP